MGSGYDSKTEIIDIDKNSKMCRSAIEIRTPELGTVTSGSLPNWLNGTYYRVGPGKFDFDNGFSMNHWFDGYALVSKFTIDSNCEKVIFETKYLDSDSYQKALKYQKPVVNEFGTAAQVSENGKSVFSKFISNIIPEISDNTNHSLFVHPTQPAASAGKLYATSDSSFVTELDPIDLLSQGKIDSNDCHGVHSWTSHPQTDHSTGVSYNIGTSIGMTGLKYCILEIPPENQGGFKNSKLLCTIRSQWTSYLSFIHSFGMTENYLIFIEQPYCFNSTKILGNGIKGKSPRDWLEWKGTNHTTNLFYIIDKKTGKIVNKNVEIRSSSPFLFLHIVNTYEGKEGSIIMDILTFENPDVLDADLLINKRIINAGSSRKDLYQSRVQRFEIPITNLSTTKGPIIIQPKNILPESFTGLELPQINPNCIGKSYKYFYASGLLSQGPFKNTLVKVNVDDLSYITYKDSESYIFGEPIYVSKNTEELNEDNGILIVPMTDIRTTKPDMLYFFNAKDLSVQCKVEFKNTVPPSMHGIFVPQS